MKIWVIGRNYPTPKNKMCGSFELEQARIFAKNGHDVIYIACPFHPIYKIKKWGAMDWKDENIHVYAYSQLYFPQRMNIYWDSFKKPIWMKLLKQVEEEQGIPDVIHIHYPTMISVPETILSYKNKGTKIIATEHWTSVLTGDLTDYAKKQLQTYVENVDHFICVGQPLKESIIKLTGTKKTVDVIPNVVPDTFGIKPQQHEGIKFVSVGRLVKVKQFDKLILAFSNAYRGQEDVSLTIIGGGSQYKKLNKMIEELGIEGQTTLAGAQDRSNVARIMSESDALVSYSRLETFGVPVIEGWYAGLPAIATTAIGFAEYWKNSLGELIPYDDEKLLEKAMLDVKSKIEIGFFSSDYIREYAHTYFSEQAVYNQLIELYNK